MKQTVFTHDVLAESYTLAEHPSGLKIYICEKPEYSSAYAMFGTRYGSIDTCFKTEGDDAYTAVPEGIAHFLEHKLFESEDGDAFSRYAKTGAMANAYTSFDRTCYLFSCSDQFEDSFRILLDFVKHPYFTEQTVEKEQGIIGQEIRMYDDSAPWRVLFNLLGCIYHEHPVKIDIAGTIDSIAEINADLLYRCYHTFYNLNNMFLCVAGNITANEVLAIADEMLADEKPVTVIRKRVNEPESIVKPYFEQKLPISIPLFAIGYKETCAAPQKTLKERVDTAVLLEALFGSSSDLYRELLDASLINENFGTEYFCGHDYAAVIFEGESPDPKQVKERIDRKIETIRKNGINESDFTRAKKKLYGDAVKVFNSPESIADHLVSSAFFSEDVFGEIELLKTISFTDVKERFKEQLNPENAALSVILPC